MTTESAPAPRAAQATAVRRAVSAIHPPRGGTGRGRAVRATRGTGRWGFPVRLMAADGLALGLTVTAVPTAAWPAPVFALQAAVQLMLHAHRGLYRTGLSPSALAELPALLGLTLVQWYVTAEALTAYDSRYAIGWPVLLCAVAAQTVLCCAARAAVHRARVRSAARHPQSALVVGNGQVARQITAALQGHPEYGLRPVGRVGASPAAAGAAASATADDAVPGAGGPGAGGPGAGAPAAGGPGAGAAESALPPVLSTPEDVSRAVIQNTVRHAVFTVPPQALPDGAALLGLFVGHGCRVWLVNGPTGAAVSRRSAPGPDHLWGFGVQPLHSGARPPVTHAAKRAMDAVLAGLALLAAAPVLALCALAVRISDGPGVIFRQERIGLHGRPFVLLKFRTLRPADAHESATRWNVSADRRMSHTGRVLRRTSLDELPQLWNVLRGDMSLVGPRPERPYFVQQFSRLHPGYQARHRMPAGITGLAQVHGLRGDTSIEDRARFDNRYIETWSLWQDVCVLARTVGSLFRLGGS